MTTTNRRIVLAARPQGPVTPEAFRLEEEALRELAEGEVLVRHAFLSLDPYMRGRMNEGRSYAAPQVVGEVMVGGTVGTVVASRSARFNEGDQVVGFGGWQTYSIVNAEWPGALRRVDTQGVPLSAYLGAVGMPGVTAWYGLHHILEPAAGKTIVVSAASGAVGSVVGQLARQRGVRAVGIAGGPAKCAWVRDQLGFDACLDYKEHASAGSLAKALAAVCPDGVDGIFENVGGMVLDAAMLRANAFARIALCGMISGYDGAPIPMAYPQLLLTNRMKVQGFIISEHMEAWPPALAELSGLVASGGLKYRESIAEGLDSAPAAFIGLLKGENFGKQLVRLS